MAELLRFESLFAEDERHTILAGLSLHVNEGEKVVIVGESGCGKTMSIGALVGLLPDDVRITSGSVVFDGHAVSGRSEDSGRIGFVPQNTSDSLHPLLKVSHTMTDPYLHHHRKESRKAALEKALHLLSSLGIEDAGRVLSLYPWQLSGGMKQRVNIAAALMDDIKLLVADEPTSALDIHIRRQIEELYIALAENSGLAMLIVSHDLGFVKGVADRIYVMYAGRIVEEGTCSDIFETPVHPYTKALIALADRKAREKGKDLAEIGGTPFVPDRASAGCTFSPRCSSCSSSCIGPVCYKQISPTHFVRCVL